MMLPVFATKAINVVTRFGIKYGPKIMATAGPVMVVSGTVLACRATLKADAVFAEHEQMIEHIEVVKELSDNTTKDYTDNDVLADKAKAYGITAFKLAKLYAPAVVLQAGGLGCMYAAYGTMANRYSAAMAALSALDNSAQAEETPKYAELPFDEGELPASEETEENVAQPKVIIDPSSLDDPFFFVFNGENENWLGDTGYVLNENFIRGHINAFNLDLASGHRDYVFMNDILEDLGIEPTAIGHFYGWKHDVGEVIDVEITPFIYQYTREDASQFPLMVPVTMEEIREYELDSETDGYGFGLTFKSPLGVNQQPRLIYNDVFGV